MMCGKISPLWARVIAACAIAITCFGSAAALAGKPGGGTTLPPVRFQVTVAPFSVYQMYDSNNLGEVVGYYLDSSNRRHACVIDLLTGSAGFTDLDSLATAPEGWYFATAFGINDQGTIVGALGEVGVPITDSRRGFVLFRPETGSAQLELIPDDAWEFTFATKVNEDDTVLGTFDEGSGQYGHYVFNPALYGSAVQILPFQANNWSLSLNNSVGTRPAQVGGNLVDGRQFRYTLGDSSPQTFSLTKTGDRTVYYNFLSGLNDSGWFCGGTRRTTKGSGPAYLAYRYRTAYEEFSTANNGAGFINEAGDLAIGANYTLSAQLYREGTGLLNLNDLVVGDAASLAAWRGALAIGPGFLGMTERGAINPAMSGYPALMGTLITPANTTAAFILVPVAP